MKKLVVLLLSIFFVPVVFSARPEPFTITGLHGKVLSNVEIRLRELSAKQSLDTLDIPFLENHIHQAVQPYGYFKSSLHIQKNAQNTLVIQITPGPQMRITTLIIRVEGEGKVHPEIVSALKNLSLKEGDPLLTERYNKAKESLLHAAENAGFLRSHFVKSEMVIHLDSYTSAITLILETGPLFRFGKVQFDANHLSPDFLHKFIPFTENETFTANQILAFNSQLSNSGYFKSVLINPKPAESTDTSVPIAVITESLPRYNYNFSAGYGTDTGPRGRAGLSVIPVNPQGHILNLFGQGSFTENTAQAQYLIPGTNPVQDKYSFTGALSSLNYDSGYSNSLLFSAGHMHNQPWFQRNLSLNALIEKFHYQEKSGTRQALLFPKASFSVKNISDSLFSPSGYHVSLDISGARKNVLSTLDYMQATLDAKAALMIEPIDTRLYMHGLLSQTLTPDIDTLPLSLAVLLGGTQDMKGYAFNAIGPGRTIAYAGLEIQKSIIPKWYLSGFIDAGKVSHPTLPALYDAGLALLWISPLGPIKVGLAQPVNNHFQRQENTHPRLVINMGADL